MTNLITIPAPTLKQIASGASNIPTMYYHPFRPIQRLFWLRLATITQMLREFSGIVLDFGGGGGVFLPTLSLIFKKVICLDLFIEEAQRIIDIYALPNVEIIQANALKINFHDNYFDIIIAADVLEHFSELWPPIYVLYQWLKPGGHLFISGPSENYLYRLGRKVFGIQKPVDHYHSVKKIEQEVRKVFRINKKIFLPWYTSMSLFETFAVFTVIDAEKSK